MRRAALIVAASIAGIASEAYAAPGPREDNSSLAVWIFLGFCALIIIAQLVPAIRSAREAARAERARRELGTAAATVPVSREGERS